MKKYTFTSANMGDIDIEISGQYVGSAKDIDVLISETGAAEEWRDIDGGSVDDIFEWLVAEGVRFESVYSLWYNYNYVTNVMIEECMTPSELLAGVDDMTPEKIERWASSDVFDWRRKAVS